MSDTPEKEKGFEDYMQEIDTILEQLQDVEVASLDTILDSYERGTELILKCEQILAEATVRVNKITANLDKTE